MDEVEVGEKIKIYLLIQVNGECEYRESERQRDKDGKKNLHIPQNAAVGRCSHPHALGLSPANRFCAGWQALRPWITRFGLAWQRGVNEWDMVEEYC